MYKVPKNQRKSTSQPSLSLAINQRFIRFSRVYFWDSPSVGPVLRVTARDQVQLAERIMDVEVLLVVTDQANPVATTGGLVDRAMVQNTDGHRGVAVEDLQEQVFGAIHAELCSKPKGMGSCNLSRRGDGVAVLEHLVQVPVVIALDGIGLM